MSIEIGYKFFDWTIISEVESASNGSRQYLCECKCGITRKKTKRDILKPTSKMCISCHNKENALNKLNKNKSLYIGQKIGNWDIIGYENDKNKSLYIATCPCGNIRKRALHFFREFKGCIKCYPKNQNIKRMKELAIENAEKRLGKEIGSFKLLKISYVKDGMIYINCQCLFCKRKVDIPNGQIPFRQSCGCVREKNKARGSKSYLSKLTEIEVGAIRELYSTGMYSKKDLSEQFKLKSIYHILNRASWKHV